MHDINFAVSTPLKRSDEILWRKGVVIFYNLGRIQFGSRGRTDNADFVIRRDHEASLKRPSLPAVVWIVIPNETLGRVQVGLYVFMLDIDSCA